MNAYTDTEMVEVSSAMLSMGLEAVLWDNGTLTVSDPRTMIEPENDTLLYVNFTNSQTRRMRKMLNTPHTKTVLGIAPLNPPTRITPVNLGSVTVEVEGKQVTIGTNRCAVSINEAETYRLYSVLHELFKRR